MTGKEKCKLLKELRARIAEVNGIKGFEYKECPYEGPCEGTCPVCDAEAAKLYNELKNINSNPSFEKIDLRSNDEALLSGAVVPPILMGEIIRPVNDKEIEENYNTNNKEREQLVLGQMQTISPKKDNINPIKPPADILSGKIVDLSRIRRGKITKEVFEKQRHQDKDVKMDDLLNRKIRGLLKKKKDDEQ